jgi:hypothetical protein
MLAIQSFKFYNALAREAFFHPLLIRSTRNQNQDRDLSSTPFGTFLSILIFHENPPKNTRKPYSSLLLKSKIVPALIYNIVQFFCCIMNTEKPMLIVILAVASARAPPGVIF